MDDIEFYLAERMPFSGLSRPFKDADYVVVGVPFDKTSTFRPGSRFGPSAIREASLNIETYSLRWGVDVEDVKICDLGDLNVVDDVEGTLKRISRVVAEIMNNSKTPILIGGEHTITFGAVQPFSESTAIVSFDAHLDLRSEYLRATLSHTTFMRRLTEKIGVDRILQVGTRAVSKEEISHADATGMTYVSGQTMRRLGSDRSAELIASKLSRFKSIYISVDMDILDPSYAPAVGNPEGDGICPDMLITLLGEICNEKVAGLDFVEVSPHYDKGATAIQTAKLIFEAICAMENHRKR